MRTIIPIAENRAFDPETAHLWLPHSRMRGNL
jgi:hypothetical protein